MTNDKTAAALCSACDAIETASKWINGGNPGAVYDGLSLLSKTAAIMRAHAKILDEIENRKDKGDEVRSN